MRCRWGWALSFPTLLQYSMCSPQCGRFSGKGSISLFWAAHRLPLLALSCHCSPSTSHPRSHPILQVESDIAPYKGLLLGLFFMSVGMEISAQLFIEKWKEVGPV